MLANPDAVLDLDTVQRDFGNGKQSYVLVPFKILKWDDRGDLPVPSQLVVPATQAQRWVELFKEEADVDVAIGPFHLDRDDPNAMYVRLVLPVSVQINPKAAERVRQMLLKLGVLKGTTTTGTRGWSDVEEATQALYRGSVGTMEFPGIGDRYLSLNYVRYPSQLVVLADQAEFWKKHFKDEAGVTITTSPYERNNADSTQVRLVLPETAQLDEKAHDRMANVLAALGVSNTVSTTGSTDGSDLSQAMRAIYRGSVGASPPGYADRFLIIDPSGMARLSQEPDFGAARASSDLNRISPERLRSMLKDKFPGTGIPLARELEGGYVYVAWLDVIGNFSYQIVFQPFRKNPRRTAGFGDEVRVRPVEERCRVLLRSVICVRTHAPRRDECGKDV